MRGWYNECRITESREVSEAKRIQDMEIRNYYGNLLSSMREENIEKEALSEAEGFTTKEVRETKVSSTTSDEELLAQEILKGLNKLGNYTIEDAYEIIRKVQG